MYIIEWLPFYQKKDMASYEVRLLPALFAAKSCRRKESFRTDREELVARVELLLMTAGGASGCGGGVRVKRKALSMRIIWLKPGRILGSSTQQDLMMNCKSAGVSSGMDGLSCFCSQHKEQQKMELKLVFY